MDSKSKEAPTDHTAPAEEDRTAATSSTSTKVEVKTSGSRNHSPETERHKCERNSKNKASKKTKKHPIPEESSSSDSSEINNNSSDVSKEQSSSFSSSSESEKSKLKKKKKKRAAKDKKNKKKRSKRRPVESDTESSDSDTSQDDSSQSERRQRRRRKNQSQRQQSLEDTYYDSAEDDELMDPDEEMQLNDRAARLRIVGDRGNYRGGRGFNRAPIRQRVALRNAYPSELDETPRRRSKKKQKPAKRASTLEYKRVDQLWDNTIHNYKLTESAQDQEDEFDQYVFTVRRRFDWENKYKNTVVDIKSKFLRDALQEVMKDVKGVSLVEDRPSVDPNMLFLYLEEIRKYTKKTLKSKLKSEKKKKNKKKVSLTISQCKLLIGYLDQDYEETKKTLYPMLEAGNITFELLWALFKPNSLAYTPTYGNVEEPRCFKVDYATKESSFMRGEWYSIEGRYLEYDGKSFGLGDFEAQIDAFKGPRKITSLASYPLLYHNDPESVKAKLIERGKRFVSMEGMNYRYHQGMAFMKKKKVVAKVNINGRIMVDPAIFRRVNPNYPISTIKPKDLDGDYLFSDSEDSDCCCGSSSEDEYGAKGDDAEGPLPKEDKDMGERTKFKVIRDKEDNIQIVQVTVDENGQEEHVENLDKLPEGVDPKQRREFTEEELIIASPVVLGFAFSEKLWLEFTISGLRNIEWNEGAFDSLVLPMKQKSIVRALVESHKFHAAKTIDDVVQGKGKGLVAVLHGPPGTGKTLTAEGIAELLKCPLYMVSAGELGTDPRILESELQKILDIAHSWGAVLLLDEADVFLEKREVHDIHRNALVSIFLRLLEYFQGILFLTTNRVETFDDAFQSRIHVALRYGELTTKAKKAVWKMFLNKVREMEQTQLESKGSVPTSDEHKSTNDAPSTSTTTKASTEKSSAPVQASTQFKESDYDSLARRPLNGRQIKNAVRTSQALAVNRNEPLAMQHILEVLEVAESFEHDLKGGTGYMDAMRSYT